jgi:endonuclease/exonuclease/phosphatase family metal-dependent hydrolase
VNKIKLLCRIWIKAFTTCIVLGSFTLPGCQRSLETTEPKLVSAESSAVVPADSVFDNGDKSIVSDSSDSNFNYRILHWNVESGGNDSSIVADQLVEMGDYDVIGLSEVETPVAYEEALSKKWPGRYEYIRGLSGANETREDDHLWLAFSKEKFSLIESKEMKEVSGFIFDDGHHRVPLYVKLKDLANSQEVVFLMNHLARGNKDFRQEQASTLREWARTKSIPIIAIGDYNLDFEFATEKGNKAFDEFMKDNVWLWVRPEPLVDTNWSDRDGDGVDNYIDSLLDFSFLSGAAKTWKASSRVIVRENDFPDTEKTSDHRPVELILSSD